MASEPRTPARPCALSIAGVDPGGGAGIAADLRAFSAAGVFGCAAVAVVTVQSTDGLVSARALPSPEVVAQAREVLRAQRVRAVKTGALGSAANVRAVARLLADHAAVPAIVDTVMAPTRGGGRLLEASALTSLRRHLLPAARLVTANADEAEALVGARVRLRGEARAAARALVVMGARAALVKGGHLDDREATDVLALGPGEADLVELTAPRLRLRAKVHGGGCALAALVAGHLAARGGPASDTALVAALRWAKGVHHAALARACDVGGRLRVLEPAAALPAPRAGR